VPDLFSPLHTRLSDESANVVLGTMFAPTKVREGGGGGFTHKSGDIVAIGSAELGTLVNRVRTRDQAPPWEFGVRALIENLVTRDLIHAAYRPREATGR